MTLTPQPFYRLARGVTCVPDHAPRDAAWHDLSRAIADMEAWIRENPMHAARGPDDHDYVARPLFERRVTEVVILPAKLDVTGDEGASGDGVYVARVCARIYVERRQYKIIRKPLSAVVDGVELRGVGPEEKVYVGDWFAGWVKKASWYEGDRAYATASIPIVRDEICWADGVVP